MLAKAVTFLSSTVINCFQREVSVELLRRTSALGLWLRATVKQQELRAHKVRADFATVAKGAPFQVLRDTGNTSRAPAEAPECLGTGVQPSVE